MPPLATIFAAPARIEARSPPSSSDSTSLDKRKRKPSYEKQVKRNGAVLHRRSRDGCYTCRLRRKKCDELAPTCRACSNLQLVCEYSKPVWWDKSDLRQKHKAKIKQSIRNIKPHNAHTITRPTPALTPRQSQPLTDVPPTHCPSHADAAANGCVDPFLHGYESFADPSFSPFLPLDAAQLYFDATPLMLDQQWTPHCGYPQHDHPLWEIAVRTEQHVFVDGIPLRREQPMLSSTEPTTTVTAPLTPSERQEVDVLSAAGLCEDVLLPNFFDHAHELPGSGRQTLIDIEDCDVPLMTHFLQNVVPFVFNVLDLKERGSPLAQVVLPQLEQNPTYLHCCLSTAAVHLKITEHITGHQIDDDIIRHRAATITSLCEAFADDLVDPLRMLESTLGMILFQSSVGSANDALPDIPWHAHFQAVPDLMEKTQSWTLGPASCGHDTHTRPLAYWIDILGATALKRVPFFADLYRCRLEADQSSGLRELMGCDDRVMYLISEIACLDALHETIPMDDLTLCTHITNLGDRLTQTEDGQAKLKSIYAEGSETIVVPEQLDHNLTVVFRLAARIYLCSLVPDFDRRQASIIGLVDALTEAFQHIPSGLDGCDRALVWPLVVAGSLAIQSSAFRDMFRDRAARLGQAGLFGSFGRVKDLLDGVWRVNDDGESKIMDIHWRDVMQHDYLII